MHNKTPKRPHKTLMSQMTEKGLRLPRVCVCLRCRLRDLGDQKELDLLFWTVQSLCSTQSLFVLGPETALSHLTHRHGQAGRHGQKNEANMLCAGEANKQLKAATNRSTETTFTHERLQGTRWSQGDSPEGPRVYPGRDRGAPRAVCQRRSPNSRRSGRVRTGLPAAWRSAPVGWLWPPAPTTPPTRAPRSAWAPG